MYTTDNQFEADFALLEHALQQTNAKALRASIAAAVADDDCLGADARAGRAEAERDTLLAAVREQTRIAVHQKTVADQKTVDAGVLHEELAATRDRLNQVGPCVVCCVCSIRHPPPPIDIEAHRRDGRSACNNT
jgi:hypothetical protein